ncbi:hypothetical protein PsYK624_172160, partial [Phanerochaete sordida]
MFATVRAVLLGNVDTVAASVSRELAAKTVLTKIVNALTSRQETGGPMVCSHLLGYPDHYTDQKFTVCYWMSYVNKVGRAWPTPADADDADDEQVTLASVEGEIRAHAKIDDWIHRPRQFEHMSVHDFLTGTVIKRLSQRTRARLATSDGDSDDDGDGFMDDLADNDDDNRVADAEYDHSRPYPFMPEHPRYETHAVYALKSGGRTVLDYCGGMLPRKDVGDHEYYCRTMLTLFHPRGWRTGLELKRPEETWADAFARTEFTPLSEMMMKNMNLLYECQDSRDDFRRTRSTGSKDEQIPAYLTAETMDFLDDWRDEEKLIEDMLDPELAATMDDVHDILGPKSANKVHEMSAMATELREIDREADAHHSAPPSPPAPAFNAPHLSPARWRATVAHARTAALLSQRGQRPASPSTGHNQPADNSANKVELLTLLDVQNEKFLDPRLYLAGLEPSEHMNNVVTQYTLNDEQRRAFIIAASHLTTPQSEPLLMYLGGTGGTGKSRVLHALKKFLQDRAEAHRFAVAAPTGAAASLVGGSTYHSMLSFGSNESPDTRGLGKVQDNLGAVDVIFIDEVSMLSCQDLYRISAQLCKAFKREDVPFGGKSVILAGDFAQLAPPGRGSTSLYNDKVGPYSDGATLVDQKKALGRAVWHMFTTVVILRKNMRQSGHDDEDYRLAGERAAASLVADRKDGNSGRRQQRNHLAADLRQSLWELAPGQTKHLPGVLEICMGMPVMLKQNEAVELCATNGAEGEVVGWEAEEISLDKKRLLVVFVKLTNPPTPVTLPGLPENVIPIPYVSKSIICTLRNDNEIRVTREQVMILPNFAMTDFGSQGRTRIHNVVHLRNSRDHLGVYTALSRCPTLQGTLILSMFDPARVTKSVGRGLKRELRELEILDDVTRMRVAGTLPPSLVGVTRADVVHAYYRQYGIRHVPEFVHPALNW